MLIRHKVLAVNDTSVTGKTMDFTTKLFKAKKESVKIQIRRVVKEKVTKRLSLASFDSRSSMTDSIMVRGIEPGCCYCYQYIIM